MRRPRLALAILTAINLLNYLDRFVVPPVGESIKATLHTTDAQFGALASAFLLVYMCSAPVFGAFGDRPGRPRLIAAGIALWSVATAAAGLAPNYPALLAARATVGIGEAAYSALAPALLADYFPERVRGRVFAIFYAAIPVGSALGYILGGLVDRRYGWRAAFFIAGLPGLLFAVLAWFLDDAGPAGDGVAPATPRAGFRLYAPLLRNPSYLRTVVGYAAYTFALGGISVWMPTFLIRVRGVPAATASSQLGTVLVLTGFVGTFVGGWVADALLRRTRQAYLWLSGVSTMLAAPLAWIALTVPGATAYWVSLTAAEVLIFASTGPINSAIVSDVPPRARAAAMAASILVIHTLGDVPSPWLIGLLSDATSLGRAVLIIPIVIAVAGAVWVYAAIAPPRSRSRQSVSP
jgi:MFS transporter, Spinster family, sphingosine-1-phosphate transporter